MENMNDKLFVTSGPNLFLICAFLRIYHGLMMVSLLIVEPKKVCLGQIFS